MLGIYALETNKSISNCIWSRIVHITIGLAPVQNDDIAAMVVAAPDIELEAAEASSAGTAALSSKGSTATQVSAVVSLPPLHS